MHPMHVLNSVYRFRECMGDLRQFDLNLLLALDALLRESSVSGAARRVGLSQPAMSHALSRLRAALDDPLLVRVGRSMQRTPRAESLMEPLAGLLSGVERLLDVPSFDPATSTRTFTIATNDYGQFELLPYLVQRLACEAPRVNVRVAPLAQRTAREALDGSDVDLVVGVQSPRNLDPGLRRVKLFDDPFVVVLRRGHPASPGPLDVETYAALPHVLVAPGGTSHGLVDVALAEHGLRRRVAVLLPTFHVAPLVVAETDYVLTIPRTIAVGMRDRVDLVLSEPPVPLPVGGVVALWSERVHPDPGHRWFRGVLTEVNAVHGPHAKGANA